MANYKFLIGQSNNNGTTTVVEYWVADTDAGKPISGLNSGSFLYALDTGALYFATDATTWVRVFDPAGNFNPTGDWIIDGDWVFNGNLIYGGSAYPNIAVLDVGGLGGRAVIVGDDAPAVASGRLGMVDRTAQTADIATTNLSSTPNTGIYEVDVVLMCTTAAAGAGTLAVTIGWTDNVGAATSNVISGFALTATGRTTGRQILRVASGDISYSVAVTGIYSTAQYAVYARVIYLGF